MMERKGLETSRYLGGDPMLSILICDDDTTVLTAIRAITESVLKEFDNDAALGVSHNKADRVFFGSALHEVGFQPEAGLAGATSADNQHILVSCGFGIRRPIIHGQACRLGEDDIVCEHRGNIRRYVSLGAPTGGAVFHVLPEFLCVLALDVDRQTNGQGNQNTNEQIYGV